MTKCVTGFWRVQTQPDIVIPAQAGIYGLMFPHMRRFWFAQRHKDTKELLFAFLPLCESYFRQVTPWIPACAGMTMEGYGNDNGELRLAKTGW
jgi:hypothetical protein